MGIINKGCQSDPPFRPNNENEANNANRASEEIKIENEITEKISLNNPFILELNESN